MGNLHLRFDEGRVGRGFPSPSLLLYRLCKRLKTRREGSTDTSAQSTIDLYSLVTQANNGIEIGGAGGRIISKE